MSSTSALAQKKGEKGRQEFLQFVLTEILKDEDNKYCADCEAKGPRWASWSLGVFICIRCAGCHRNLGVHISRVKSVNLDQWTDDQVSIMQQMGNRRAKMAYESLLPENFRRPQTDYAIEQFIRAKYEQKRYVDRSVCFEIPKPKPLIEPLISPTGQRTQTARVGHHQRVVPIVLPPVPSPQSQITSAGGTITASRPHRTPSSSSLSPPLSAKGPISFGTPGDSQANKSSGAPIIDLFDNEPIRQQNEPSSLAADVGSIHLSPEKPPIPQQSHQSTSTFDDLSFLAPPQQQQQQQQSSSHPQQHHQRSISNFDLMTLMPEGNNKQQPLTTPSIPVASAAVSSPGGAHDDILSLYKQQPYNQPASNPNPQQQGFGAANFPIFSAAQHAMQSHHQRNFSDATLSPGLGMPYQSIQPAVPMHSASFAGGFQLTQQPMQGFGMPMNTPVSNNGSGFTLFGNSASNTSPTAAASQQTAIIKWD